MKLGCFATVTHASTAGYEGLVGKRVAIRNVVKMSKTSSQIKYIVCVNPADSKEHMFTEHALKFSEG